MRILSTAVVDRNVVSPSSSAGIFDVEVWAEQILLLGQTSLSTTSLVATTSMASSALNPTSSPPRPNGNTDVFSSPGEQSVPGTSRQTIIGASIGATLGGILLICVGSFLVRDYRRKRQKIEVEAHNLQLEGYSEYGLNKPELEGSHPSPTHFVKTELDANATRAELKGHTIEEMDGVGIVAELEG